METNSLLVILFHGVGGGNGLDVSLPNHRQFLSYLKQQKDIWIPTMLEAAEYINRQQSSAQPTNNKQ
jgi:sialate O-acetylesterase